MKLILLLLLISYTLSIKLRQDDEYYNPNVGVTFFFIQNTDPNKPPSDSEGNRKKEISNGMLLSNKKRTINVETGKYKDIYGSLSKD